MYLTFGLPIHFSPVCVRHRHGFYGGPIGYERTTNPGGGPIEIDLEWGRYVESVIAAWRRGEITLVEARDELDRRENQHGLWDDRNPK